jgi:hypothetical protein
MPVKYSAAHRLKPRSGLRLPTLIVACVFAALAALAPASLLASCSRKGEAKGATAAPAAKPQSASPKVVAQTPPPATVPTAPKVETPKPIAPAAAKPARLPQAPLAASMRAFGLRSGSTPRIASDYSIGPLQSYIPAEGDEAAVWKVALAFADGIAAGKLDAALLLPEARDALSVLLSPPEPVSDAKAARPYRLGAIVLQGQGASLRIRLPGVAGSPREEGLLSLRKAGDAWYVEALALDPPASGALAFNPDSSAGPR